MYDLTIKDNHNFALDVGVFVHNSKDIVDSLCGSVYTASKYAEEYAYSYGEDYDAFLDANETPIQKDENFKKQLLIDFEEELKNMNPLQHNSQTVNRTQEEQQPFIMDGVIIW